jgi:hypothetical protein
MSPQDAHLLVGHAPDIAPAAAQCPLLLCARVTGNCQRKHDCRAIRASTDPAWQAQLIKDALREGEGTP